MGLFLLVEQKEAMSSTTRTRSLGCQHFGVPFLLLAFFQQLIAKVPTGLV